MINVQNPFLKIFSSILANRLSIYAEENNLLPKFQFGFRRNRCPKSSFFYNGQNLEIVNNFKYLGFTFTVQLSFTRHLENQIVKARSRIGQLYATLPIMKLPLDDAL